LVNDARKTRRFTTKEERAAVGKRLAEGRKRARRRKGLDAAPIAEELPAQADSDGTEFYAVPDDSRAGPVEFWRCECGHEAATGFEVCPECSSEVVHHVVPKEKQASYDEGRVLRVTTLSNAQMVEVPRDGTGKPGLDRVLGGGLAKKSTVLLAGEPGAGKSTILTELCRYWCQRGRKVLYGTSEQSESDMAALAARLNMEKFDNFYIAPTRSADELIEAAAKIRPSLVILDSVSMARTEGAPEGEIAQIKAVTEKMVAAAKKKRGGFTLILVGHFTKDDDIGGPRLLEHAVDTVLIYSVGGDNRRFLRSGKNRFGPTGELAVFDMTATGLREVSVTTALLEARRNEPAAGYVLFPTAEWARPVLLEIECRVGGTALPGIVGERKFDGLPAGRMPAILSILREDLELDLRGRDVFAEASLAIGGKLTEPAVDLAVALAIVSSALKIKIPPRTVAFGAMGLSGHIKPVARVQQRLQAAADGNLAKTVLMPASQAASETIPRGMRAVPIATAHDLLQWVLRFRDAELAPVAVVPPVVVSAG